MGWWIDGRRDTGTDRQADEQTDGQADWTGGWIIDRRNEGRKDKGKGGRADRSIQRSTVAQRRCLIDGYAALDTSHNLPPRPFEEEGTPTPLGLALLNLRPNIQQVHGVVFYKYA